MNHETFPRLASIEITCGTVRSLTIATDVGKHLFYVDALDTDGDRITMWNGDDREEAFCEAQLLADDIGGQVWDLTGGAS